MSDPGYPPTAYQPPPPPKKDDVPAWVLLSAIGALVVGLAVLAGAYFTGALTTQKTQQAAPYPSTWDPRIVPYVDAVEKERGLKFQHPVAVRFLPAAAFKKTLTVDQGNLDAKGKADIRHTTGLFRALGLIKGNVDLLAAFNDAHSSGTLAYYSFDDQRITVRGNRITLASHATLVHELTHAIEDQLFGIGKRLTKLRNAQQKDDSSTSEADVYDAIIEGDASRTATLYRESLQPAVRRALVKAENSLPNEDLKVLAGIPQVVLAFIGAPYTLGEAMVQAVATQGGNHAVDDLLRDSPTHDAALLDPFQVLTGQTGAARVTNPALTAGEKKFYAGEFGALSWDLVLAGRLPLRDALAAADGWNGDSYVGFERGSRTCFRVSIAGDTSADSTRMYEALRHWIDAVPGTPATVARDGSLVLFESCDPGKSVRTGNNAANDAIGLAATRAYIAIGMMRQGAPTRTARCLAGKLINVYSVAQLNDPTFGAHDQSVVANVRRLAVGCR